MSMEATAIKMGRYFRNAPSTKARREGYNELHKLQRLLFKLFLPEHYPNMGVHVDHWVYLEFQSNSWRDFMIRHTPALKRGGPATLPPSKSKRKQRREKERRATIR